MGNELGKQIIIRDSDSLWMLYFSGLVPLLGNFSRLFKEPCVQQYLTGEASKQLFMSLCFL